MNWKNDGLDGTNSAQISDFSIVNKSGNQEIDYDYIHILDYTASLNKYILSGTRSTMSNTEKDESPVVVKKGDTITYRIEIKNEGNTILYSPQVEDSLPAGLKYKSHSEGWTPNDEENPDTYTYNGNLAKKGDTGDSIFLNITCEVTMSNMYLYNIENIATYGEVNNHNNIAVDSVLSEVANSDYIRLDELTIAGNVWEDNNDGLKGDGENGISGIEVLLHDVTSSNTITTTTDSNGNYSFDNVQKGKVKDENGNYQENAEGQGYKEYYIEFKYNGTTYKSTLYSNQSNLTGNGTYNDNYLIDSNAAEITEVRTNFNNSLEKISYNKAEDNAGNVETLSYTKNGNTSTLDYTDNLVISSYSFIDPANNVLSNSIDKLWLYTDIEEGRENLPETNYLQHINLGLIKKDDVDIELFNEIDNVTLTINGHRLKYDFKSSQKELINIYKQDLEYINPDISKELNIEVTYKTTIKNNSNYYVKINEFTNYYDSKFKDYDASNVINANIDIDNDGAYGENANEQVEIKSKITGNATKIDRTSNCYDGEYSGLKSMEMTINNPILPNGQEEIFVTYIVDKNNLKSIVEGLTSENKNLDFNLISIIEQYSAYTDVECNNPAGVIDIDSNPGNLGLKNNNETSDTTTDVTTTNYETAYYEDDTKIQRLTMNFDNDRILSGFVWEDTRGNEDSNLDNQKIGDGQYDSETRINDVTVNLYSIEKNGNNYLTTKIKTETTKKIDDENGKYQFDIVPGTYIVEFEYGNNESKEQMLYYNGHDYKSTKYTGPGDNINGVNNLYTLMESNDSNARDDEKRRLEVMNYSVEMYNEKANILKGKDSSNKEDFVTNTKMNAETPIFTIRNEAIKNDADTVIKNNESNWEYNLNATDKELITQGTFNINNIDFGLEERPKTEISLNKYIKEIKLTTSSGDVLVHAIYDENSNLQEEKSIGIQNLQALNNTEDLQGFRYLNVDEELLQGATIQIKYGFKVTNNSEVDHIGSGLYVQYEEDGSVKIGEDGKPIPATTTADIEKSISNAITFKTNNSNDKYLNPSTYYGQYLGGVYYTGNKTANDKIASLKVDMLLDYVDNELTFSSAENEEKWGTILVDELETKKYLDEDVFSYIEQENGTDKKTIIDIDGIEYQTDNKNNLAVTKYDNGNEFALLMEPGDTRTTELIVSTFLSPENDSENQMVYENIAEIIKFTTLTGRRIDEEEVTQTIGNAKVHEAGYINSDDTLEEPDTSITEKVLLTPPTGLASLDIKTRITLYSLIIVLMLIVGIKYIPKLIKQMKNLKFIK